jgi:N-carbamoylputrescine amidase
MAPRKVRVALVQLEVAAELAKNLQTASGRVAEAARAGAELVLLPELFATPYFCQTQDHKHFALAEPLDGQTCTHMAQVAKENAVHILVPFFERRAPGVYHNSLTVFGPSGERLGLYRKLHIPDDPQFEEKFYFSPGDLGFQCIQTSVARLGTLICWDQWYPEAARATALLSAELLAYPTAIGWLPEEKAEHGAAQLDAWKTIQRSHAIANGLFVLSINRVGVERSPAGSIEFWGHSFVCDPMGQVLAEAGEGPEVLHAELDLGLIESTRQVWPFFRDRRVDTYAPLLGRWSGS